MSQQSWFWAYNPITWLCRSRKGYKQAYSKLAWHRKNTGSIPGEAGTERCASLRSNRLHAQTEKWSVSLTWAEWGESKRQTYMHNKDLHDFKCMRAYIGGEGWMLQEKAHGWIMTRLLFPLDLTPGLERGELVRSLHHFPPWGLEEKRKTEHRERKTWSGQSETWGVSHSRPWSKWCFLPELSITPWWLISLCIKPCIKSVVA